MNDQVIVDVNCVAAIGIDVAIIGVPIVVAVGPAAVIQIAVAMDYVIQLAAGLYRQKDNYQRKGNQRSRCASISLFPLGGVDFKGLLKAFHHPLTALSRGCSRFLSGLAGLLLKAYLFLIAYLTGTEPGLCTSLPVVYGAIGAHPFPSRRAVIGTAAWAAALLPVIIASAAGGAAYGLHLSYPPLQFFLLYRT